MQNRTIIIPPIDHDQLRDALPADELDNTDLARTAERFDAMLLERVRADYPDAASGPSFTVIVGDDPNSDETRAIVTHVTELHDDLLRCGPYLAMSAPLSTSPLHWIGNMRLAAIDRQDPKRSHHLEMSAVLAYDTHLGVVTLALTTFGIDLGTFRYGGDKAAAIALMDELRGDSF